MNSATSVLARRIRFADRKKIGIFQSLALLRVVLVEVTRVNDREMKRKFGETSKRKLNLSDDETIDPLEQRKFGFYAFLRIVLSA